MQTSARRLDPLYYMDHFHAVLNGVERRYGDLLDRDEQTYIEILRKLPDNAAQLYARLVNRKGPVFRADKLKYFEISDITGALETLIAAGLLMCCKSSPDLFSCERIFKSYTCVEWRKFLSRETNLRFTGKDQLYDWFSKWQNCDAWLKNFLASEPLICLAEDDLWPYLRFLFFGELKENLADFAVRDLDIIVPEERDESDLISHFKTRDEARACYKLARLYQEFREIRGCQPGLLTYAWWQDKKIVRGDLHEKCHAVYDRLINRLGKILEREGALETALDLYATSPHPPNNERYARILIKLGRINDAENFLTQLLAQTEDEEERETAEYLLARINKKGSCRPAREFHRSCPAIKIDYNDSRVEQATLEHYQTQGWDGIHCENWIWNALFGLVFWDIIFDPSYGSFHSPLQLGPSDLYDRAFYQNRKAAIESRLLNLQQGQIAAHIDNICASKYGTANAFVFWHDDLPSLIARMLEFLPASGLVAILRRMAQDLKKNMRGFPDLFLWRENEQKREYRFIEVKSENDHLAANQYRWLRFFKTAGIEAGLIRVERPETLISV